ncbi:pyridoxal phosphate-dependent transferase [Podospora didyma]|uniref:Pyridoxal phosphate-dependent transferase n=1 Tax=Podospora didyma TaxID=330526 RepID=A0AAE0P605_9PEZI|nr:pyridoxal phosphate-dependent transferase [Podospora didyma]
MAATPVAVLDMDQVRGHFPALNGKQVYMNNAGGSQTLKTVAERVGEYLLNTNPQLTATGYAAGYAAAAKYVGATSEEIGVCPSPFPPPSICLRDTLVFVSHRQPIHPVLGSSTTQLFRNVSYAFSFQPGDELVVSSFDHESNIGPWVALAERQSLVLKWWQPVASGSASPKLLASDLRDLLSAKTRLVTCTHASNILGSIHDIKAIVQTVRNGPSSCSLVCVDGVAYAPHRQIDVKDLGVDLYAFSWYKVYGPHIAMLYASPLAQTKLQSLGHFFFNVKEQKLPLEQKLGLAGSSSELVHAIPAVLDYLGVSDNTKESSKWAGIVAQESQLQETLLSYLTGLGDDVIVWGERSADPSLRVATISFTVKGQNSQELVKTLQKKTDFVLSWGDFYSARLVNQFLGLDADGVVRVSMVHYNTIDEVKRLIKALDTILSEFKQNKPRL